MSLAATTVLKPAPMATNCFLISSPSFFTTSHISCSSLSILFKPLKFQLSSKKVSSLSIPSLFSVRRKEPLFRICVVTEEENNPVIVEEREEEIQGKLDWSAAVSDESDFGGEEGDVAVEPNEKAKVYVGNLPYDVDSENLAMLFEQAGVVEMAEVIYNKATEQSRGFGFVTMSTEEEAAKAVEMFNRYDVRGRLLTVNIAAPRGSQPERAPRAFEPSNRIYVGNLPWSVDSDSLEQVFSEHGKVVSARVVTDRESGRSRGFGFVEMSSESEMNDAIANLDGQLETKDGTAVVCNDRVSDREALKVKEWEVGMFQEELAASQGIKIRRRPPTGPPLHYVGPFEFRLQNEGNTPRDVLEEIVWYKDMEVSQMKERKPLSMLKKMLDNAPPARDFVGALKAANLRTGLPGLIAEVKKASPSRGVLREDFNPVQIAKAYEKGGAACLSVLTDEKFFQGSFDNLEAIRSSGVQCPLLCKEFVIDAWQIYYARVKGADAILLIAAVLHDLDIKYMIKICKLLGLTALVEVHDEREMDRVLEIEGIELVGINNRDLGTFKVDISNTKKLLEGERGERIRQKGIIVVGESGLFTPADVAYVQGAGVKAVLVGESIVKQKDPTAGITQLFGRDISS